MVIVINVGRAIGIITLSKYLKSLHPSTFAALYILSGICLNVCLKKKIKKISTMNGKINAWNLLYQLNVLVTVTKFVITYNSPGTIIVINNTENKKSRPLNSNLEKANADKIMTIKEPKVVKKLLLMCFNMATDIYFDQCFFKINPIHFFKR